MHWDNTAEEKDVKGERQKKQMGRWQTEEERETWSREGVKTKQDNI